MSLTQPLQFPRPWPPPNCPFGTAQSTLEKIPIVGRLLARWRDRRRWWVHVREVLIPIEQQIVGQLLARSATSYWADSPPHQRIADLMATVIAEEKGLSHVVLHPDDPVELLFWGAYDDMSLLRFALRLRKECGVALSREEMEAVFEKHMTVSELIGFCLAKTLPEHLPEVSEVVPSVVEIENGGSSGPGGGARAAFRPRKEKPP